MEKFVFPCGTQRYWLQFNIYNYTVIHFFLVLTKFAVLNERTNFSCLNIYLERLYGTEKQVLLTHNSLLK